MEKILVGGTQQVKACGICTSLGHFTDACPTLHEEPIQHADAVGGFSGPQYKRHDPFFNTYNPGWRDHLNLRYGNQSQNFQKPPYQRPPPPPPQSNSNSSTSLEDMMKTLVANTQQFQQDTRASIQNLESQVGQLASSVSRLESQGKLPSQTIINPKQNASAIVLCSGKELKTEISTRHGHVQQGKTEKELKIPSKQAEEPDQVSNDIPKVLVTNHLSQKGSLRLKKGKKRKKSLELFAKWRTKIDVHNGTLTMEFDGEVIRFNIYESMQYPSDVPTALLLDATDPLVQEFSTYNSKNQTKLVLERILTSTQVKALEEYMALDLSIGESTLELEALPSLHFNLSFIELPHSHTKILPSILQAPTLELKELPKHLKYAFLGENDTLPVIISNKLSTLEEEKLIHVLREFREAIGWTIADIKGLSPYTCMHRILLEEGGKPSREAQRRLNPPMMEVVKKEILKLLNAGHVVSSRGIEVDQAKIDIIKSLSYPVSVREIRSFLGHAGFYRRFIKDFSKIAEPLCKLLQKDKVFEFDEAWKQHLTS
ncbi:UNVERIFIED_CONTAM: hypothetical protein Scaly_2641300 [Sesamum calycinum]|uniref:Reverse transcriptase n=1 Tax=Sesamum calycinum TaxID=2727403 RepID=A0AAW2JBM8_9LAMI